VAGIRLSSFASVVPTTRGVQLRSDLGAIQIDGPQVQFFITDILPLLDGTRDKQCVAADVKTYSRRSILELLDNLEQHGFLETVPEEVCPTGNENRQTQHEFFRSWTEHPEEMSRRLTDARVLIVGLQPWGARVAGDLAAAGVGALYVWDDGVVTPDDLAVGGIWSRKHVGQSRSLALAQELRRSDSQCGATAIDAAFNENLFNSVKDMKWSLVICATVVDDLSVLQSAARFCNSARLISLSGALENIYAKVGPLVVPRQTACWNCCRLRELVNSPQSEIDEALHAALISNRPKSRRRSYLGPMSDALGALLSLESLKFLTGYVPSTLVGHLLVQNLVTLETSLHKVIRVPGCQVCGNSGDGKVFPAIDVNAVQHSSLTSTVKPNSLDVVENPHQLRQLLAGWVDERTGIIKYLTSEPPDLSNLNVAWTSTAIMARAQSVESSVRTSGFGAGLSAVEAMTKAAAEAVELYAASRCSDNELLHSSVSTLTEDFLDPRQLYLYNRAQYQQPDFPYHRFNARSRIAWTRGQWLDTGAAVWLPAFLTYFGMDLPREKDFSQVTTSGIATGTSLDDASMRAVCELLERDAFMTTWLCQVPARPLLPDSALEHGVRGIIREFEARGMKVRLYLLSAGTDIPVVLCLVLGDGKDWPGATVALGAHASAPIAARKAILEQALVGPSLRREMVARRRRIPKRLEDIASPLDHALYYIPKKRARAFDFLDSKDIRPVSLSDLEQPETISLEACVKRLNDASVRVAIKDMTPPDVATESPFRVVRAMATMLQPIHFGFNLARLASPRLKRMAKNGINRQPHPLA
jgi:ribosomal protein S12 methylthiotransferase accessory factor